MYYFLDWLFSPRFEHFVVTTSTSKYLIDKIITFLNESERNVWHPSRGEMGFQSGKQWVAAQIKWESVAQHRLRPVRRVVRDERGKTPLGFWQLKIPSNLR